MSTFEYVATVRVIVEARHEGHGAEIVREQLEEISFDIQSIECVS
jgi:hypothetical protein